jgi:hypothetical protein
MIVAQRGLGGWIDAIGGIFSTIGGMLGNKQQTVTLPAECAGFDAAGQSQCAQMWASVQSGQVPIASYQSWVSEQTTMATIKKYAPYAIGAVGIVVIVSMLRRPRSGSVQ